MGRPIDADELKENLSRIDTVESFGSCNYGVYEEDIDAAHTLDVIEKEKVLNAVRVSCLWMRKHKYKFSSIEKILDIFKDICEITEEDMADYHTFAGHYTTEFPQNYKGYDTIIKFEDKIYHGKIEGITDLVTFEGKNLRIAILEFHNAVDDYINHLTICKEIEK